MWLSFFPWSKVFSVIILCLIGVIRVFWVHTNEMKKGMTEWKGIIWGYWARVGKSQGQNSKMQTGTRHHCLSGWGTEENLRSLCALLRVAASSHQASSWGRSWFCQPQGSVPAQAPFLQVTRETSIWKSLTHIKAMLVFSWSNSVSFLSLPTPSSALRPESWDERASLVFRDDPDIH